MKCNLKKPNWGKSGIYIISNSIDKRVYIGSAVDLRKRYIKHRAELIGNSHHNAKLQRFVNKYGLDTLQFDVIEFCEKENLLEVEQSYMNELQAVEKGFNISYTSTGGRLGRPLTGETIKRIQSKRKTLFLEKGINKQDIICEACGKTFEGYKHKNAKYCTQECKHYSGISVKQFDRSGIKLKEFKSIAEAARILGITSNTILSWHVTGIPDKYPFTLEISNPDLLNITLRKCETCNSDFYPDNKKQKYCSHKCRVKTPEQLAYDRETIKRAKAAQDPIEQLKKIKAARVASGEWSQVTIYQYDLGGKFIKSYESYIECARYVYEHHLGNVCTAENKKQWMTLYSKIRRVCKGERSKTAGYIFSLKPIQELQLGF